MYSSNKSRLKFAKHWGINATPTAAVPDITPRAYARLLLPHAQALRTASGADPFACCMQRLCSR